MGRNVRFLLIIVSVTTGMTVCEDSYYSPYSKRGIVERRNAARRAENAPYRVSEFVGDIVCDALWLNLNLISWGTYQIFCTVMPAYVGTRMADERLQSCFFDHKSFKNVHECPYWLKEMARLSVAPFIAFFGIHAFIGQDPEFRVTSQIMLIGLPFMFLANRVIKQFNCEVSLRPWHEKFSHNGRIHGGFPSGHTSEAAFLAVLYGLRYGPKAAIPLSILTAFVGSTFVAANRHYVSQVVAGVAFGAMYGLAASKLVDIKLAERFSVDICSDENSRPALAISYRF